MRRSIRKTPTGQADSDSIDVPISARRMNSNSTNGPMSRRECSCGVDSLRTRAHRRRRPRSSGARAADSRPAAPRGVSPQATGRRARSSVCGKCSRTSSRSWSTTSTVRSSPCQRWMMRDQVAHGARVDGVERLVEQDQRRVLQQHACEERALQLAAGERVDAARLKARQADRCERHVDRLAVGARDAPEHAAAAPEPERNEIDHAWPGTSGRSPRSAADRRCRPPAQAGSDDAPAERLQDSDDALEQRRFSRPVRADDGGQRSHLHVAVR